MGDIETFGNPLDLIYGKQREDVARMRAALLSCSSNDLYSTTAKTALKNITALRIYHQISRIIRYLELMDKLEDKMYRSLDHTIDALSEDSASTWTLLLKAQENLQKQMIESHKLLQPYLDLKDIDIIDMMPQNSSDTAITGTAGMLSSESRERIRNAATAILSDIENGDIQKIEESDIQEGE